MVSSNTATAEKGDISDLNSLVSSYEDSLVNSNDLAFLLVTHNYNAFPRDGYVELMLSGKIYSLIPNGEKPGLCDIGILS
ncbi:MAG: hypothetical protein JW999_09990 [Methanotrichaceae archaeon]|nr:hypothetical protein [Methanotrichaceae archaeon]